LKLRVCSSRVSADDFFSVNSVDIKCNSEIYLCKSEYRGEHILSHAADRTYPVIRKGFEKGAWGDASIGIADFRVIDITAWFTFVILHIILLL